MNLKQNYLTESGCYKAGKRITVKGLMIHSVGCPIGINLTESCLYSKFGSNLLNAVLFFYPLICIVFMKFQANVKAKSP